MSDFSWFGQTEFIQVLEVAWWMIWLYLFSLIIKTGIFKVMLYGPLLWYIVRKEQKEEEKPKINKKLVVDPNPVTMDQMKC